VHRVGFIYAMKKFLPCCKAAFTGSEVLTEFRDGMVIQIG